MAIAEAHSPPDSRVIVADGVPKTDLEASPLPEPDETLMIDNFDSFTWNLYQYLSSLGAKVKVIRNDAISVGDFPNLRIRNLVISPGPGHPRTDSGVSRDAIRHFAGKVPILGVCMGLECFVDLFGGEIAYAGEIMHGKTSKIRHDGRGLFKDVPQGIPSTRYHSLSANVKTIPDELAITATTQESGVIMGVRHRKFTIEAVQYHPESIMSVDGMTILKNFLELKGGTWDENPQSGFKQGTEIGVKESPASNSPTILEKIYAQRMKDVELAKTVPGTTPEDLDTFLGLHLAPPLISFYDRVRSRSPALMAEIKRASPSKGSIALKTNAAQQATTYALGGASVISVLTEPTWFKGSLLDMRLARQAVESLPNRPAILRKDFILDEYQISEARLHGADTVLLIVAMLSVERLESLYAFSVSLGMEPLVEVNNAAEMEIALDLGAKVIGVNNRNLHDFEVDMGTTSRLAGLTKERDVVLCALSGITKPEDVRNYVSQRIGAVLVGEALMRASDPLLFIQQLLDLPARAPVSYPTPLVKICGVRSVEEAVYAAKAGADIIGLVFAAHSKRAVDDTLALLIVQAIRQFTRHSSDTVPPHPHLHPLSWFAGNARQFFISSRRPHVVGVFQHQSLEEIQRIVSATQIDLVQLHGDEPLHWARHIPTPVIRTFHLPATTENGGAVVNGGTVVTGIANTDAALREITRPGLHEFVLLDSVRPGAKLSGGSGMTLDWDVAKRVVEAGETSAAVSPMPIILAGGLTVENVASAVARVKPWAVDVSSGVETDGRKDLGKITAFIHAAKFAQMENGLV
ncbi:indole-3-glycerol phosphate synthase-domain-containing protein [Cantharellus anzutake]|uniref:indole-3-glycerol phosphate synthase-domain-containing protein n=1 Tax=Cantharellus anzutake TaxID=1750568 RepID=UPI0019059CC8|nr:indole-3-glycerol phosphate synthase-domain-containing protein [Cantharellus anzutake]KAF8331404.1 indole-3-glycerol phosphate synthase-domain-containing protein [Cantharellus anzutake]